MSIGRNRVKIDLDSAPIIIAHFEMQKLAAFFNRDCTGGSKNLNAMLVLTASATEREMIPLVRE